MYAETRALYQATTAMSNRSCAGKSSETVSRTVTLTLNLIQGFQGLSEMLNRVQHDVILTKSELLRVRARGLEGG